MVPAHGRSAVIGSLRRVLAAAPVEVLVVLEEDDHAVTDLVEEFARSHLEVHLLHRRRGEGVGTPQREGLLWGLERGYQVLVTMDLTHPAEQLPAVLAALEDADLVLGSRHLAAATTTALAVAAADDHRLGPLLSRAGNACLAAVLRLPVHDVTTGFRAFRREVLLGIGISALTSRGSSFRVDTAHRAHQGGYRLVEVPVVVTGERGATAAGVREVLTTALTTTMTRLRARPCRRGPLRLPERSTRVGGLR
ncbi:glycosyltransferase [Kineococcus sp. GCM10028916]|uniref:glycosyltransferase n=1 Tax=Kineococcus sp. GCM10028916 TaxID=3273394 RepID=UPI00363D0572